MPPVSITTTQKTFGQSLLTEYRGIQKNGATDSGTTDDVVVSDAHAQQCSQSTPQTPLFLPLDPDPTRTDQAKVMNQLSDNAQLATFMALAKLIYPSGTGITTDVVRTTMTRASYGVGVTTGNTAITLSIAGALPHSTGPAVTGVPVDSGSPEATYVEIVSATNGQPLIVDSGVNAGQRIFGRTRVGASTAPNSVEIELVSRPLGAAPGSSVSSYTWEAAQPTTVNLFYGFRQLLNQLDDTAFRRIFR